LGFSLALCFVPGGFLALLGLVLYGYDYRRGKQAVAQAGGSPQAVAAPAQVEAARPGDSRLTGSQAGKLRRAAEYRLRITRLIEQQRGAVADQLGPITNRLDAWEDHLRQLVERLHRIETDSMIQQDF